MPFTTQQLTYPPLGEPFEINYNSPQAAGLVACWPVIGSVSGSVLRDRAMSLNGTISGATLTVNAKTGQSLLYNGGTNVTTVASVSNLAGPLT